MATATTGWSTNPADFAYAELNSPSNKVCRSFGDGDYASTGVLRATGAAV